MPCDCRNEVGVPFQLGAGYFTAEFTQKIARTSVFVNLEGKRKPHPVVMMGPVFENILLQ